MCEPVSEGKGNQTNTGVFVGFLKNNIYDNLANLEYRYQVIVEIKAHISILVSLDNINKQAQLRAVVDRLEQIFFFIFRTF